jgi:hypothetical protein
LCYGDDQQGMDEDPICRPRVTFGIAFPHATGGYVGEKLRFYQKCSINLSEKMLRQQRASGALLRT